MISIIIPVYNQAKKISACLDSILKQTERDFEIIIVDDGSTDGIDDVLKKYENIFLENKINLIFQKQKNQGAPTARNNGFNLSRGEYVLFCDADIEWISDALKIMLRELNDNPQASYVYPSFKFGWKLFKLWEFDEQKLRQMPYIHPMALMRRQDFPGFDPSLKKFQDWDLFLTMLENGHKGKWINEVLFTMKTGGTMSSWLPGFAYKIFPFLKEVKKYNNAKKIISEKHNLNL